MMSGEERTFDWGRGWAAAGAFLATLILLGMVVLVAMSNKARDAALESERHAYDVNLLTRNVDATLQRSQNALGTFVLDEKSATSGNIYYSQWRLAGEQINQLDKLVANDRQQSRRVDQLEYLYRQRGTEFATAARSVSGKNGTIAINFYYAATQSPVGPTLAAKLTEIADSERAALETHMAQTQFFSARADRLTDYLSWLGMLAGVGGIILGSVAIQALRQNAAEPRMIPPTPASIPSQLK